MSERLYPDDVRDKDGLKKIMSQSANRCPAQDVPIGSTVSRMCPLAHEIRKSLKGTPHEIDHPIYNIPVSFNCGSFRKKGEEACPIEDPAMETVLKLLEEKDDATPKVEKTK